VCSSDLGKREEDYATLETDMDRDNFMSAKESVDYGLADKIMEKR
jgi:ATP-dependent protease ClpP protease subunit